MALGQCINPSCTSSQDTIVLLCSNCLNALGIKLIDPNGALQGLICKEALEKGDIVGAKKNVEYEPQLTLDEYENIKDLCTGGEELSLDEYQKRYMYLSVDNTSLTPFSFFTGRRTSNVWDMMTSYGIHWPAFIKFTKNKSDANVEFKAVKNTNGDKNYVVVATKQINSDTELLVYRDSNVIEWHIKYFDAYDKSLENGNDRINGIDQHKLQEQAILFAGRLTAEILGTIRSGDQFNFHELYQKEKKLTALKKEEEVDDAKLQQLNNESIPYEDKLKRMRSLLKDCETAQTEREEKRRKIIKEMESVEQGWRDIGEAEMADCFNQAGEAKHWTYKRETITKYLKKTIKVRNIMMQCTLCQTVVSSGRILLRLPNYNMCKTCLKEHLEDKPDGSVLLVDQDKRLYVNSYMDGSFFLGFYMDHEKDAEVVFYERQAPDVPLIGIIENVNYPLSYDVRTVDDQRKIRNVEFQNIKSNLLFISKEAGEDRENLILYDSDLQDLLKKSQLILEDQIYTRRLELARENAEAARRLESVQNTEAAMLLQYTINQESVVDLTLDLENRFENESENGNENQNS